MNLCANWSSNLTFIWVDNITYNLVKGHAYSANILNTSKC